MQRRACLRMTNGGGGARAVGGGGQGGADTTHLVVPSRLINLQVNIYNNKTIKLILGERGHEDKF